VAVSRLGKGSLHVSKPAVLFVCVKNAGKSQMAAALMRKLVGDRIDVYSAGTNPGDALNDLSVRVLAEAGAPVEGEHPKPIDPRLLAHVDVVVTLGREAHVDSGDTPSQTWDTDEPSERGIEGIERMRLVRDDIAARVDTLAAQLLAPTSPADR
jgi:arsenate-mycothiol transferase